MNFLDVRKIYRRLFEDFTPHLKKDWDRIENKKTLLPSWDVRDIISHLTIGALKKLSAMENQKQLILSTIPQPAFNELSQMIDQNNEKWVQLYRELNGRIILDQFIHVYDQLLRKFESIGDLDSPAVHNVLWAHNTPSPLWLDIAREYTELWIHSSQILEVMENDLTRENQFLIPFLETCYTALDYHFKNVPAPFSLLIDVEGLRWLYTHNETGHLKRAEGTTEYDCRVILRQCDACKIFSGTISPDAVIDRIRIDGNPAIAHHFLQLRCVMVNAF